MRSGYAQLLLMVAGADADFMERMRSRISALCAGWDVAEVRAVIEQNLPEILSPMIYAEASTLIDSHRERGHEVVVVSASGEEMVAPIAEALGAVRAAATRMTVADGRYTGEIDFYCYGEGKAEAARRMAADHGYRLEHSYAYSDSITDLPLLEAVGHPHAVNPDRALRRIAVGRGWPVLNFVAPIPLRTRMSSRVRSLLPKRIPVAVALSIAGFAAVLAVGRLVSRSAGHGAGTRESVAPSTPSLSAKPGDGRVSRLRTDGYSPVGSAISSTQSVCNGAQADDSCCDRHHRLGMNPRTPGRPGAMRKRSTVSPN